MTDWRKFYQSTNVVLDDTLLYRKKPWVPYWLWKLVAQGDLDSLVYGSVAAMRKKLEDM